VSEFSILQNQFQSYLLNNSDDFSNHIISTKKVSKEVRLEIYKNAYELRLQEALCESYSALRHYLGNKHFDKLCIDYIKTIPSQYRSIRWYGDQLPLFMRSHKKYKKLDYLSELAEWEWVSGLVFDAPDANIISLEDMSAVQPEAWESVCFTFHPSIHILNLSWNTVEIWEQLSDKKTPNKSSVTNKADWIIWRKDLICQYAEIQQDELYAIKAGMSGENFSTLCEGLCHFISKNKVGQRAASLLKRWILSGLITEIKTQ